MDTPPASSPPPPGKVRRALFRVALGAAFGLMVTALFDRIIHHQILRLLTGSEWDVLFAYWWLLTFLLAVLFAELLDLMAPNREWYPGDYLNFMVIFCIFGFFVMPLIYFGAIFAMMDGSGGPGD